MFAASQIYLDHAMSFHTYLPDRGVIAVTGDDSTGFLQGIVSNDVEKVTETNAGYGAFLTPQGKYLYDFFMARDGDAILVDTERARIDTFIKRLAMYKLRAKVQLEDVSDQYDVAVVFGNDAIDTAGLDSTPGMGRPVDVGCIYVDPRLADAGVRAMQRKGSFDLATLGSEAVAYADYDQHRIGLGLPDGSRDLVVEKSVLLENGFDELNGVDWGKGCYMGQEVTARTKHRGLVKKRLMPVDIDGPAPEPGTPIMADDREAGEMRSSCGTVGLAVIKLDYVNDAITLNAGDARLAPRKPSWATY